MYYHYAIIPLLPLLPLLPLFLDLNLITLTKLNPEDSYSLRLPTKCVTKGIEAHAQPATSNAPTQSKGLHFFCVFPMFVYPQSMANTMFAYTVWLILYLPTKYG